MDRTSRIILTQQKLSLSFLLLVCFLLFTVRFANAAPIVTGEQFAKWVSIADAQSRERKKELKRIAAAPLTEAGKELLTQLLTKDGSLEEVLSSQPYLTYLKKQVGTDYEDFTAYLAAMPTAKRKTEMLFVLKKALPSETPMEEFQHCLDYHFKLRKVFMNPLYNSVMRKEMEKNTFYRPLMNRYSEEELPSKIGIFMLMSLVIRFAADTETEVFHDAWHQRLKTHSSREGLLRCAIATPTEFALVRSFFEDTKALEKWILLEPFNPPKTKKEEKSQ